MIRTSDTEFAAFLIDRGHEFLGIEKGRASPTQFMIFAIEEQVKNTCYAEFLRSEYLRVRTIKDGLTKTIKAAGVPT